MGDRINNINKMMKNTQQRNMYFVIIALVVFTLGIGFWFATRSTKNNQAPSGASISGIPQVQSSPGTSTNPEYNKRVQEDNKERAANALEQGKTAIPTLTRGNLSDTSPLDMLDKQPPVQEVAVQPPVEIQIPAPVVIPPAPTPVAVVNPIPEPAPAKKYGSMEDYMLLNTLSGVLKVKAPSSEFDYARTKEANNAANMGTGNQMTVANNGQVTNNYNNNSNSNLTPIAKAGTIYNAILETGINSDEPSPVLAKIVSGNLKGARLIGQVGRVGEKVVVQFSTMSLPNLPSSVKMSAVAVDTNTSRTALASEVNNHYFQKYGIMIAASFLSGYANAIARQNTTTILDPLGGATVVQGQLSNSDISKQALGSVGKEIAETARSDNQNIKPTVTVHEGIAIGVLIMDDLIIR